MKKKDKMEENYENESRKEFRQDLSQSQRAGMVFMIDLLMKEPVKMPDKEQMITGCTKFDDSRIEAFERSQMWDCENSEQILKDCRYHVLATNMLAAGLLAKERAELDMDFLEAVVELYPECEAVYFPSCGKMFTADDVRNHQIPRESRFIYFGVNVRFFNIQGTNDMMIDTLGMGTLFLPDMQYHFHDMEPKWVVNHAYDTVLYIFENDNPIQSGDMLDGIVDGKNSGDVQWECQYENALVQPAREVLDVNMGEYAAGIRE